ncbi:hypothetical protein D3C87_2070450 [compost metagenome]
MEAVNWNTIRSTTRAAKMNFRAGTAPCLSASFPPQILPIATETPYPNKIQLTALGEKPARSCIIGARKVNAVKTPP